MKSLKNIYNKGFAHLGLTLAIVVLVGVGGVYILLKSDADSPYTSTVGWTSVGTGKICTNASCSAYVDYTGQVCRDTNSKGSVFVKGRAVASTNFPIQTLAMMYDRQGRSASSHLNWSKSSAMTNSKPAIIDIRYHYVDMSVPNYFQIDAESLAGYNETATPLSSSANIKNILTC